jgi:hypothetical protein
MGEQQRARYRRRRHHENIGADAFARERKPLVDAEAMLLVDDRKREILVAHVLGNERVRTHHQVHFAGSNAGQRGGASAAGVAPRQDGDANSR